MLDVLNNYDWGEAFDFADGFEREDVAQVLSIEEGENDGEDWLGIFRLNRAEKPFAVLRAWCDYTGWG